MLIGRLQQVYYRSLWHDIALRIFFFLPDIFLMGKIYQTAAKKIRHTIFNHDKTRDSITINPLNGRKRWQTGDRLRGRSGAKKKRDGDGVEKDKDTSSSREAEEEGGRKEVPQIQVVVRKRRGRSARRWRKARSHGTPLRRPRIHTYTHTAQAADINNSLLIFICSGEMWGQSNPNTNRLSTCLSPCIVPFFFIIPVIKGLFFHLLRTRQLNLVGMITVNIT